MLAGDPNPSIRFQRSVIISPCLLNCDPYGTGQELQQYCNESQGPKFLKKDVIRLVKRFFPDSKTWKKATLLANPSRCRNKPLLLLAGDQDIFLLPGYWASEVGAEFVLFQGKHHIPGDDADVEKIVQFLKSR